MISMITHRHLSFYYSVYQGISPSLLATISIGQGVHGSSHIELVQSLKKQNIIQSEHVLESLKAIDRQLFTHEKNPYQNRPYKISNKQNMTDVLTHAIILQNIQPWIKFNKAKVLDIGSGHGYLTFAMAKLAQTHHQFDHTFIGIDISDKSVAFSKNLIPQIQILPNTKQKIDFKALDIEQYLKQHLEFDIIVGGFYMESELSKILESKLSKRGIGIWPSESEKGQILYKFTKEKQQPIVSTLFSPRKRKSSVSHFFIEDDKDIQDQQGRQINQQTKSVIMESKINKKQQLQQRLRLLIQKYRIIHGITPSLSQIKQNSEMSMILQQLNKQR